VKAEAEVWRGELAAAEESALAAAEVLQPGSAPWFRALTHAVVAAGKRGGTRRIEARAEQVAATAPAPGARSAQIVCLGECATHLLYGGRYAEADRILARLHAAVPEPTLLEAPVAGQLQQIIALRALYEGDPAASLEGYEAALSAYELASDRRSACVVRCSLGCIFNELGDFESAEEALRLALAGATRMGLDDLAAAVMTNLGQALAHRSRLDEARLYAQRAVEAFHRLGDPRMEGVSRTYLAKVDLRRGDLDRAEAEARLAADLLAVAPPVRPQALATLARVLLTRGRAAEALAAAREAQAALDEIGTIEEGETLVRLVYVDTLSATGDGPGRDEAAAVAQERLLARAERISDPAWRERFLTGVPDNARTLALGGR
jgi:ATP/maltotriose-dependent transcriptional regulator MalT